MTIKELHEYIENHATRNKILPNWTPNDVAIALYEAYKSDTLRWCSTPRGVLCGVIIGKPDYSTKTLHIVIVIADDKNVMARFMLEYLSKFDSSWRISGNRRGKLKVFSTKKLCSLIH